ncbi:DNA sulfur modification protein DndB [Ammoniphilus sp. 3BR4]|uniref:DNA sulfur modification protein DndB n=1 Tax=Ammoniphilus sp. 3BR4 TaxID=3158265 RepID=UPI00346509A0
MIDGLMLPMVIHPYCEKYGLATVDLKVQDILNYVIIDPMVQRKLSTSQRKKIANYLQEREIGRIFFGPVTLSLREVGSLGKVADQLYLRQGSKLSILDGQHRILALSYVNEQMQKQSRSLEKKLATLKVKSRKHPNDSTIQEELEGIEGLLEQLEKRRLELMESYLAVQLYIGLKEEEEQQLFGDINSKVLLVSKELGHSFDSIDPLNLIIQQVVEHNVLLKGAGVEKRANLSAYNKCFTSSSWLYATASILFSGRVQPSYELLRQIRKQLPEYTEIFHQFFSCLLPLMPEQPGLPLYTSSSRTMQESIALYTHQHIFKEGQFQAEWKSCLSVFSNFDWSHNNKELEILFGKLDNGKLNLIHDKSFIKHNKLVNYFNEMLQEKEQLLKTGTK